MTQTFFNPIFDSFWIVAAIAGALAALLLLRPVFESVAPRQRVVLTALRLGVILLLVLLMLRPTRISTEIKRHPATLILLGDRTRSMQQSDAPGGASRWQAQQKTLTDVLPLLERMSEQLEVQLYWFDETVHPVRFTGERIESPGVADGSQTDIGTSLDDAVRREMGKRLAAVVLLGDGAQRAFAPRVEAQQAARELARRGCPLFTITYGLSRDQTQARDVAMDNLADEYTGFVNNEKAIDGLVRVQGYVNQDVPVRLVIQRPDGETETLGPTTVRASEDDQQIPVQFAYVPEQAGQYMLTMQVDQQPGESDTKNNSLVAFLNVRDSGVRVLYVESNLLWREQRELRRSLAGSADIQLDFVPVHVKARDQWPIEIEPLLADERYDVFILGDVDATALGEEQLRTLADRVDQGKGLIMLGGYHSFGPGGYGKSPLADVLPIVIDRFERQDFDGPDRDDLHINRELTMLPTRPHFITHLAAGGANVDTWRSLPTLLAANKFAGLKPQAIPLAESAEGDPLLVAGQYGLGRTLALAVDSTWRWHRPGSIEHHKRFWRQAVLWLAQKEDTDQEEVWIKLARRRFDPTAEVTFAAGARSAAGDALAGASFAAQVIDPLGNETVVRLSPRDGEMFGAFPAARQAGKYTLVVTATQDGQPLGEARRQFQVLDRDPETVDPVANPQHMAQLAKLTAEAGGKPLPAEQLAAQLEAILASPRDREVEQQTRWQLSDTTLDAWLVLLVVVGLLTGEWVLRKKWAMV